MAEAKQYFKGPLSVAIGYDDPALPAKILRDFIAKEKRDKKMRITVGSAGRQSLRMPPVSRRSLTYRHERFCCHACSAACRGRSAVSSERWAAFSAILSESLIAIKEQPKEGGMAEATATKLSQGRFYKLVEGMTVLELDEYVKALQEPLRRHRSALRAAAGCSGGGAAAALRQRRRRPLTSFSPARRR